MKSDITVTNAKVFARYADQAKDRWQKLLNIPVIHVTLGTGVLTDFEYVRKGLVLCFKFCDGKKGKFYATDFPKYFLLPDLPEDLQYDDSFQNLINTEDLNFHHLQETNQDYGENNFVEKSSQTKINVQEQKTSQSTEFQRLVENFIQNNQHNPKMIAQLKSIIKKRENIDVLSDHDIFWMIDQGFEVFIIDYYQWVYKTIMDPWALIKAARLYRKLKQPQKALDLLNNLNPDDRRTKATILTVQSVAYKDMGEFNLALQRALEAHSLNPDNYYVHNVMGSIYYKLGDFQRGDQFFDEAIRLGSSPRLREFEITSIFKYGDPNIRHEMAKHLLDKQPERYHWARRHLKRNTIT